MPTANLLQERRRLGPLREIAIQARSLTQAHGQLGEQLGEVIRSAAQLRLRATPAARFAREIADVRKCRWHLNQHVRSPGTAAHMRRGLREYLACLDAWTNGSELAAVLDGRNVEGKRLSAAELALWLQDDNTGCQTGLLRLAGGDVLFWHTEEDTIGYFDIPRLATLTVGKRAWRSFLYAYLLPGPAFGWQDGYFQAVDSLHIRRWTHGALTSAISWLTWRLGGELDHAQLFYLCPFIDGCAINRLSCSAAGVSAAVHEVGGDFQNRRTLGPRPGSLLFQANCVGPGGSRLAREESLSASERKRYCDRLDRTQATLKELWRAREATPQRILELLASRRGGSYAYANADVKAHCVGMARADGMELYVQSGAALPGDEYRPQFYA